MPGENDPGLAMANSFMSEELKKAFAQQTHPCIVQPQGPSGAVGVDVTDLRSFPQSDIENWFSYHAPTPAQIVQYGEIRTAAKILAETINRHVPSCADKTAAMRELRMAVMAANAAIACNTKS